MGKRGKCGGKRLKGGKKESAKGGKKGQGLRWGK